MTVRRTTGKFNFACDSESERSGFVINSAWVGAILFVIETKVMYGWDGTEWVVPVPISGGGGAGNLDGGSPDANYQQTSPIDGGNP